MCKRIISVIVGAALSGTGCTTATAGQIEISGTLVSEVATATATGNVQKTELVLTPEMGVDVTASMRLTAIARLRGNLAGNLEPDNSDQGNRASVSKRLLADDHVDIELRELYIDTQLANAYLRIGKQQVVWGQADGLKVLDVLNPQSFREFILDDFEDSRIPLWSVNAEIPVADAMLQLLWIPDKTYDDIPAANATFALTSPQFVPILPVGVPVSITAPQRPGDFFGDSDIGVKLSVFTGGWDLSLNYAYHYFDRPVPRRRFSKEGITVTQKYERTHLFGGTFSNVFGEFTVRGEAGFSSDRYFLINDKVDTDGVIRSSEFSYVVGVDYQGWRDWFISSQIFQSNVVAAKTGIVRDRTNTTATLLVRRDFMNDTLQVEALLIQSLNQRDSLLQVSLNYEFRTNVRISVGADIFDGDSFGIFGQFDDQDRISVGIEIGF